MDNQNHHLEIILLQIDKDRNHLTDSHHAQHILHHLLQHSVILQLAVLLHVSHRTNILLCHQIDLHLVNDIQICQKQTYKFYVMMSRISHHTFPSTQLKTHLQIVCVLIFLAMTQVKMYYIILTNLVTMRNFVISFVFGIS